MLAIEKNCNQTLFEVCIVLYVFVIHLIYARFSPPKIFV